MEFLRTANAGGLLKMDGISILLDGVCSKVEPYEVTPMAILDALTNNYPDAVGFTHRHPDHFLSSYVCNYENNTERKVFVAADVSVIVGAVQLRAIPTRHLGKVDEGLLHSSFLIEGSKRVLFTGDAAPAAIKGVRADVVIAPFAYANTPLGLKTVKEIGAKHLVLVHMPEFDPDPYGIWESVRAAISGQNVIQVHIPKMGECIIID